MKEVEKMKIKKIATLMLIVVISIGISTSCAPKEGVTVDGNKVGIAETKCSISFVSFRTTEYDGIEVWEVNFKHSGDHDFSSLVWQTNAGFAPSSEISYYLSNGSKAHIIAGNIGYSRAYMEINESVTLRTCDF